MLRKATIDHLFKHLNSSSQVVLRADFNVPIQDAKIADPSRIIATIPTINELLKHNPKSLVILSHMGRPNGYRNMIHTLRPVAEHLSGILNRKVTFLEDCVGDSVVDAINKADNEIFLCENVRFHPEEEGSRKSAKGKRKVSHPEAIKKFRQQLSLLGNVFVNDAFGTAHRAHSSVVGIAHKYRVAGLLMKKELEFIGDFIENPKKPVLVILGGAKVTDKIALIDRMIDIADEIIIGGGMRFPFLQEMYGIKLGKTRVKHPADPNKLKEIIEKAKQKGVKIHFPNDNVCAVDMKGGVQTKIFTNQEGIPDDLESLDTGPKSTQMFERITSRANSIFWNGPMGVFQLPEFRSGSADLLKCVAKQTKRGAISIVGGGDSVSMVNNLGSASDVTYISTGGGATLELMQGNVLPGVKGLCDIDQLK